MFFLGGLGFWISIVCFQISNPWDPTDLLIVSANSIAYFIPTITVSIGYSGRTAQFMTIPIHGSAVVSIILVSLSADYFNQFALHVAIPSLVSGIMYAACIKITDPSTRYGLLW